jgi:hypothetical protein
MPSLTHHPSVAGERRIYKGLHVGVTGTGKTGALASLVEQGYKLRILDFEDGLDPIAGYISEPKRKLLANVSYHTLKDEFKLVGSYMSIGKAPSFQRAMALLNDWKDEDAPDGTWGPVSSWGDDTILVLDTLGSFSRCAFNMVLQANAALGPPGARGGPEQSHYGAAQTNVERVLDRLTTPELVPCHVIVNAHWTWQDTDVGTAQAYPATIGKALSPNVGQKFNNMLGFSAGPAGKLIKTQRDGLISLKSSKPLKESYQLATGLAEIFKEVVGPPPAGN